MLLMRIKEQREYKENLDYEKYVANNLKLKYSFKNLRARAVFVNATFKNKRVDVIINDYYSA